MEEWIWRDAHCSYQRVFAGRIGVRPRGCSRRLERAICDFGAEHSFAQATQRLAEHYGLTLGASRVREVTLRHGKRAQDALTKEYAQSFRSLPAQGAGQVVAEADGTMICTVPRGGRGQRRSREWKEMRLVAAQAQGQVTATYAATFETVAEVGRRWGHCAKAAGWGLQSQIHVVADGAEWIRLQSQEVFAEQAQVLLDFYHVSEYLAAAAPTCRPRAPEQWRHTQQQRLRTGASAKILAALELCQEPPQVPEEQAPVRAAHRYLRHRLDQLDYPRALRLDLPIGSGMIESGHRHVLQQRLKRPGTAWLQENAETLAQLRVLRSNGLWSHLWN